MGSMGATDVTPSCSKQTNIHLISCQQAFTTIQSHCFNQMVDSWKLESLMQVPWNEGGGFHLHLLKPFSSIVLNIKLSSLQGIQEFHCQ